MEVAPRCSTPTLYEAGGVLDDLTTTNDNYTMTTFSCGGPYGDGGGDMNRYGRREQHDVGFLNPGFDAPVMVPSTLTDWEMARQRSQ